MIDPKAWAPLLAGPGYADLYLERSTGRTLLWEDGRLEEVRDGSEHGAGLRFMLGREPRVETRYGSVQGFDAGELRAVRDRLLDGRPAGRGPELVRTRRDLPVRVPPSSVPLERKIELLAGVDAETRALDPAVRQVTLTYAERERELAVLNSEGRWWEERRTGLLFVAHVVAEKDGVLQSGHEVLGSPKGFEALDGRAAFRLARLAARRALAKLGAPKAVAGEMPVVVAAEAGGTLIHEAIGHSLEADHVQEGTSPAYKGKLGAVVAPEGLTIIDDPTLPFYRGSYAFDDEGVEARPAVLVERGVLKDYLYDRQTAAKDAKPSNGHGRRESYQHRPIPRMSNLYIAPGTDDPARILKELDRGLLVTRMGGGQVNTGTGEFMFEVDEGWWVEGGKPRHMVRDANLLGTGPEILRSIDRIGWDIGWAIGTCGKDGQGVPVADGQPTLRIPKILIGGAH